MAASKTAANDPRIVEAVHALNTLGYTYERIAEILNQCVTTVSLICRQNGFEKGQKAEDIDKQRKERFRMAQAYRQCFTDSQIAAYAQVSIEKVKSWRLRNDLPEYEKFKMCRCTDCKYHSTAYGAGSRNEHGCDYAVITGTTRTAVLTRTELKTFPCKCYESGSRQRAKPEPLVLKGSTPKRETAYDWALGEQLYYEGKTDTEIAQALGCSYSIVPLHRKAWGAPNERSKPDRIYDWALGFELYKQGKTNKEISIELGCSVKSVETHKKKWKGGGNG